MPVGLPVQRVINISISLTALPATFENFDTLLILGDSNVIDTQQRIRAYSSLAEVATDFGTSAPEYFAARDFFSQVPEPDNLYIGRWAKTATHGKLVCGALTGPQQVLANWTSITDGSFHVAIDGAGATSITACDFSGAVNLNGVASVIQTKLNAAVAGTTCQWFAEQDYFVITSPTTGAASTIGFLTAGTGGTDISAQLKGTAALANYSVAGIAAETAVAAVAIMDQLPTQWYALTFAAGTNNADVSDADYLAVAGYIEASGDSTGNPHMFGLTTGETTAINSGSSADIGSELMAAGYQRSFVQYSTTDAFAVSSMFGRLLTVDFEAQKSTINLQWKREPGVTPETLNTTQANTLDAKRYNYYVNFNNNTAIIIGGRMAGPAYIDEIYNMDAYANRLQTDLYNVMITTNKVPQTDPGVHLLTTACNAGSDAFVNNAFLAPGVWQSDGFGTLKYGDVLPSGYYVFAPPVAIQPVADRGARISPTIQIAAKEAGAINEVVVNVVVNR